MLCNLMLMLVCECLVALKELNVLRISDSRLVVELHLFGEPLLSLVRTATSMT
jgi:hypothetical protein